MALKYSEPTAEHTEQAAVRYLPPLRYKTKLITGFGIALLYVLAFSVFFVTNFRTVVVSGPSMLPTFHSGTRVLVSRAYWLVGPIKPKDIVVIKGEGGEYIIKRVYKMGGETVDAYNAPRTWNLMEGEYKVPENNVYVLGDNREVSEDSRAFGPVDLNRIIGKVVVRPTFR